AVTANRKVRDRDGNRPEIPVHVRSEDSYVETGRDRLGVMVGDDADIGTQANLMPGVCIGQGSFVGPSALLRHNLGEESKYLEKVESRELER
ncbi:MAG: hypothetical protein SVS85_02910, partial [Candidatus Nanohaloarchaea archaeon]|nr:hypothetical protein [Candidatus Nanohaloarchaea archaeon]